MTTPTHDEVMQKADVFAFHMPGSKASDDARAALSTALTEVLAERDTWEAECARFLIGERDTEPNILNYGDDIKTPEEWKGETHIRKVRSAAHGITASPEKAQPQLSKGCVTCKHGDSDGFPACPARGSSCSPSASGKGSNWVPLNTSEKP